MSRHVPVEERAHGDEIRAKKRRQDVEKEWRIVDRYLDENARDILLGECPRQLSEQRIDELFAAVEKDASGYKLQVRHNYLADRLQQVAREHNLDLPNQQRMVVLHGESAPATPAGFEDLAIVRDWVNEFWADIKNPRSRDNADEQKLDAGRLIFSFIAFGGVHSKKKLSWLVDAIPNGLFRLTDLTWMDIETSQGLWRWYPDPVSMLLLQRWYRTHGLDQWPTGLNTDIARLTFNYLRFLKLLQGQENKPKQVFRQLIDASSTMDATWMEGTFHHVQRSLGATVSLPADAWARLLTKKVPVRTFEKVEEAKARPLTDLKPLTGRCDSDVFSGVRAIRDVLNRATAKSNLGVADKTYQELAAIAENDEWAPIVRTLASWAAHLRRYGGRQKRLVTSSIKRYLSPIAKPLAVILAGTQDLNVLGEDEWQEVYDRLLARAGSGEQQSNRAKFAAWFHEYLVEQFGMPEVEIEGATPDGKVDANILTPAEYIRSQNILAQSEANPRLIKIRQLVLTLGFRCGLRRTEVLKILIKDLQGLIDPSWKRPELITRGNKFAGQKSSSGTRRLPLWALLTESELNQFREWYQYRLREPGTKNNDLLFCAPQRGNELIPQRELFTPIQEAMRVASGTDALRFHHLRHSCVTLTGLRLFERQPGELMKEEWAKDDMGNMVMPHWGHDIFSVANRTPEWAPTRKKLWFLALISGHASPGQTLKTYAHLVDYANGVRQCQRRLPALVSSAQANLLGSSPGSLEVFRNRNGLKGTTTARDLATVGHRRWPGGICHTAGKNLVAFYMPEGLPASRILPSEPYTALMIYDALFRFNRLVADGHPQQDAISSVARNLNLSSLTLEAWLSLGKSLMQKRVRKDSRRSGYSKNPDREAKGVPFRDGVGGVVMPELPECPAPPKSIAGQHMVEDVFSKVRGWLRDDPGLAYTAIQTVSDRVSSSKTQISFTELGGKLLYLELLQRAGLESLAFILVRAPKNGVPDEEVKANWAETFKIPLSDVLIAPQTSKGNRFAFGSAQVRVRPAPWLGKAAEQDTMTAIKFSIFVLMLSCAGEAVLSEG